MPRDDRDDCDCDCLPFKHIKCKFIRLLDKQMKESEGYIEKITDGGCRGRQLFKRVTPYFYCLGILMMVFMVLVIGASVGAALCGTSKGPNIEYGVF